MPEYLAPGVYVEEVSYRAKSIEGVATSTTGFAIPILPDTDLGSAILIIESEGGQHQPISIV